MLINIYAESGVFILMLSAVMLNVIVLNVVAPPTLKPNLFIFLVF